MFSLPWLELSRFKRHAITRLAMIVIAVIPAIYGGLYLASHWSPTDTLDKPQAAVVNEDTGAEKPDSDGETLHAGDELVDEITPEGEAGFDWEENSEEEADEGLAEGKYFAVLEIPSNFSERLVSTGGDDPEQAALPLRTDDAHHSITGPMAGTVLARRPTRRNQTTAAAAAQARVGSVVRRAGAGELVDGTTELDGGVGKLQKGIGELDDGAGELADGSGELKTGADTLAKSTTEAKDGSKELADGAG